MAGGDVAASVPVRRLFVGRDGLRAGWSLAIYYGLAAVCVIAVAVFQKAAGRDDIGTAISTIVSNAPQALALCLLALLLSRIERRPFAAYGLARTHIAPDLAFGFLCGFALLSLLVAVMWLSGALAFGAVNFSGGVRAGAEWLLAFLLVGFVEEFWFRGFFQFTLARGLTGFLLWARPGLAQARAVGFWLAAAVFSGLFFVLAHVGNGGETKLGIVSVALAGFVFAYGLYRSGALWWSIGFHAAWDWTETFVFGASDSGHAARDHLLSVHPIGPPLLSGTSAGPEGSLFVLPVLLLAGLIVRWRYKHPPAADYAATPPL